MISLGRTLLQDIYESTPLAASLIPQGSLTSLDGEIPVSASPDSNILLQPPTAEEIASYFNLINPLRYSQPHQPLPSPFSPPLNGLTITAYNAGHTLGGTIWHIQHGMESVVYAVDWNLTRENVISGASWLDGGGSEVIEQLRKPTALICSSHGITQNPQAISRPKRDESLVDIIRSALNKGGVVLIPSDSSARVLELTWLLENTWRKNQGEEVFRTAQLVFASRTAGSTMDFTRSMIEWMDENVTKAFETDIEKPRQKRTDGRKLTDNSDIPDAPTSGPFTFKHLRLVESSSRVRRLLEKKGPTVIIASDASFDWGFSQLVVKQIADDANNLVLLTSPFEQQDGGVSSPSSALWKIYQKKQNMTIEKGKSQPFEWISSAGHILRITNLSRKPLDAIELVTYQQYLATQRQLQHVQNEGAAKLEDSNDVIEDASSSSSSSDESDNEQQGKSLNFSSRTLQQTRNKAAEDKEAQGVNALLRKPGFYDWDVRGRKGREAVFPFFHKRKRADEYGELIRAEDYLRAEERDEIDGRDMRDTTDEKNTGLGEKRKWGEISKVDGVVKSNGKRPKNRKAITNGSSLQESSSESEGEEEIVVGPSKLVKEVFTVPLNLGIAYLDFSGIHDGRSLTMLIPLIRPRKVILTAGTEHETTMLADECRQRFGTISGGSDGVLTPVNGERVAASMDTNAWTVKLSRGLVKKIQWQEVRGVEVVTVMGRLVTTSEDETRDEQKRKRQRTSQGIEALGSDGLEQNQPPTLDVLPANIAAVTRSATQAVHVGDVRLADLRKILQTSGHTADFRGEGTLVIDNVVAVKKSMDGRIELESSGNNTPSFQRREIESPFDLVKKRIYEGLAVIAGG